MKTQPAGTFNNEPEPIKSILARVLEDLKNKKENNDDDPK